MAAKLVTGPGDNLPSTAWRSPPESRYLCPQLRRVLAELLGRRSPRKAGLTISPRDPACPQSPSSRPRFALSFIRRRERREEPGLPAPFPYYAAFQSPAASRPAGTESLGNGGWIGAGTGFKPAVIRSGERSGYRGAAAAGPGLNLPELGQPPRAVVRRLQAPGGELGFPRGLARMKSPCAGLTGLSPNLTRAGTEIAARSFSVLWPKNRWTTGLSALSGRALGIQGFAGICMGLVDRSSRVRMAGCRCHV